MSSDIDSMPTAFLVHLTMNITSILENTNIRKEPKTAMPAHPKHAFEKSSFLYGQSKTSCFSLCYRKGCEWVPQIVNDIALLILWGRDFYTASCVFKKQATLQSYHWSFSFIPRQEKITSTLKKITMKKTLEKWHIPIFFF